MRTQEKERVIKAINELGRKVSVADVATKTGLPLVVATSQLNQVAADTKGHLQVSTAGDITYQFDYGFQSAYLAKGIERALRNFFQSLFRAGFFLLRISFGIMLILSLVIIVAVFFIVMQSLSRGNDSDSDSGFNFDFFDYLILRDLLFWDYAYSPYRGGYGGGYGQINQRRKQGNFLYNCFSFLFGDGNPNAKLEEERWQMVAKLIRERGGVVTADELTPYTDADPKNEDGVLPVLVRFDGRPEVTDSGNIVYLFPSLQVSAGTTGSESSRVPAFLRELRWPFTNVSSDSLTLVGVLAAINFLGSWWLFAETMKMPFLHNLLPLTLTLVVYGSLFVLIPLGRWISLGYLNGQIDARNSKRQEQAERVKNADRDLSNKLAESGHFRTKLKQLDASETVYTTDKDLLEQEIDAQVAEKKNGPTAS
jgi:hypothetical protein